MIEVADHRLSLERQKGPLNKQLAHETGLTEGYTANIMVKLMKIRRAKIRVPHETLKRALFSETELNALLARHARANVDVVTLPAE